ncbi:hypothetical protein [Acinetobacter baumannii]|uniref:hypothetical protein n=1 Tax=Acinetobacter baumannii TaxID=470 RepID=UPI00065F389D|nr:hypothetical protein [Acinetobacter baumannii]AKQ30323.1 hypothetical protein ACX61_07945 [Acinetobacter baumannii]EHU3219839.1 hypothetical protein [Acinetobacter baumannii]KAA8935584.1 hypothetical protein DLI75_14345 [Acinetobacter baumannii]KAA8941757.1 hypothetical protein DLI74_13920 [Acinetobacter baumannii]KOP87591.1 hypothetical protein AKG96_14140 [Acinetobacter baumannii]
MKIKNLIENVIAISFVSLLFVFALTWVIFNFNDSSSALKDTWSIVGSIFGGITTLAAAYIAYYLYDDWRKPHNINIETDYKKEILKVIRKIIPMENKYHSLISNYHLYPDNPERNLPIQINTNELQEFIHNVNELIGLLDELYYITKDENINNIKSHYLKYAQLYHHILFHAESFYSQNDMTGLHEFLMTKYEFDFINIEDGSTWTGHTIFAFAFQGINQVKIRKYFSENLKLKEH